MSWFESDERATAMGTKQTGVPAGGVLTALLAPQLVLLAGWRGALAGLGVINFLFGFIFWAYWREPAEENVSSFKTPTLRGPDPEPVDFWRLVPISCGTAIYLVGQLSLLTYVPLYIKDAMGLSPYWASQALALTQAGGMVGRVGWGLASDRLFAGRRKIVLILVGLLSAILIGVLSLMTPRSPWYLLLPTLFVAGICLVGYQGVSYALIGELAGKARTGRALGMMITINAAVAAVGTPLFGFVVDRSGSYAIGWQVLAGALTLGIVGLATLLREPQPGAHGVAKLGQPRTS